jgi:hypothetical protein
MNIGDTEPDCPCCHGEMVKKVSEFSFKLKGPNWAKDGYNAKTTVRMPR